MTLRRFGPAMLVIALLALTVRTIFPAADPPWRTTAGVVWHDEGAWVHNARNKALFGAWHEDEWNPIFVAPVFTGLEYASFEAFGVGVRQARLVCEIAGWASVLLLALGMRRLGGDAAGLIAGALLATNYVYVMYDRAALMEGLMAAFMVASWYCTTRAETQPRWGAAAGVLATLAFFTKASAVFYVGALVLVMIVRLRRAAFWTLAGLGVSFAAVAVIFVLPHWTDYRFYNWQMSVTRKPSYDLKSIVDRVTGFPIYHDVFTRMWAEVCIGIAAAWGIVLGWRRVADAERLLLLWLVLGSAEMLIHDVGNERRFVQLIPALVALTARALSSGRLLPEEIASVSRRRVWLVSPFVLYSLYVISGPMARLPFIYTVRLPVRIAAVAALLLVTSVIAAWPRLRRALATQRWTVRAAVAVTLILVAGDLAEFGQWAAGRTYKNFEASIALGRVLPPGTPVQGKLANGLSLENRIRPIFIGHGFGNYADRKQRDDVRYILTYIAPRIGYEGSQITDVLAAYPGWRIIMTFDVAETPGGHDTAALIEKRARH
jgi:4-amino-4-deoxy-L-arabinose transferase-like glycosyltransferase